MMDVSRIGFIQGRLSPQIGQKIQAFPGPYWKEEFPLARSCGFSRMEWTLDQEGLFENPLLRPEGRELIRELCRENNLMIGSVTGDFFMQAPFFKAAGSIREELFDQLVAVIEGCAAARVPILVLPLVDQGRIEDAGQEEGFFAYAAKLDQRLRAHGMMICLESDLPPEKLGIFLQGLDPLLWGVNYDIGNSAAFGFDYRQEIPRLATWIKNVHVKDRVRGGGTVPLGQGQADIRGAIHLLEACGYRGNYILQTARSPQGLHAEVLSQYRDMVISYLGEIHGS
ncbi:MAG: sugar phosphate isomerase/epimerase [Candidatus Omnitrophica bacterium]|nr:sugar phosphate isomerase/epimerase [Candidatus Omnitrophota bacterium]